VKTRTMSLIALLTMMLIGCDGTMTALAGNADPTPDLRLTMRKLWEEHVVMYTRNYTISSLAGLKDADKVAERLLKNQDDIGGRSSRTSALGQGTSWRRCCEITFGSLLKSSRRQRPATEPV
jgi:hypothetical protein